MIYKPYIRSAYNYDRDIASLSSGLICDDESLTQQNFAEEVDINTLVRRFHLSGEMPGDVRPVTYGDFTGVSDFHSAANAIALARESFDRMPAELRRKFNNDPQEFVAFCSDESNLEEMRKLGLAVAKPEAEPVAPVVPAVIPPAVSEAPGAPGAQLAT